MNYIKHTYLLIFLLVCFSCTNTTKEAKTDTSIVKEYHIEYAKGFTVKKYTDYTEVSVINPWDTAHVLQTYILVNKNNPTPPHLPEGTLIKTPLEKVIAYSSVNCTTLDALGALNIVKGVCEPEYMSFEHIHTGLENGQIIDVGQAGNPDIEKIIMVEPDAILASPIQGLTYGSIEKTGIAIIETPDYMEATPLARAEWIRFYSLFVEKEALADSLFKQTVKRYNDIKEKTNGIESRPTVFLDLKYGNTWYISGGKSYTANMLKDAGATYIWEDDNTSGSSPLPFETILDKAGEADFWLIKYNAPRDMNYTALEKEFKPYSYFNAFKKKNIYACNTGIINYYEELPLYPDRILKDMAYVFHPELFPDYTPAYYTKMQE